MLIKAKNIHPWNLSPREAVALQRELAQKLLIQEYPGPIKIIGAADVAFKSGHAVAAVCLFKYPSLEPLESRVCRTLVTYPYVPGLLTFREAPALIKAFKTLSREPDVIIFDGQGIAHPRRFGIASHIGLLLDKPSIGCAKSMLCGIPEKKLPERKGAWVNLLSNEKEVIGAVVRSREKVKPLYISPGHRISLRQSVNIILSCCLKYRIPEPVRAADRLSKNPDSLQTRHKK